MLATYGAVGSWKWIFDFEKSGACGFCTESATHPPGAHFTHPPHIGHVRSVCICADLWCSDSLCYRVP